MIKISFLPISSLSFILKINSDVSLWISASLRAIKIWINKLN